MLPTIIAMALLTVFLVNVAIVMRIRDGTNPKQWTFGIYSLGCCLFCPINIAIICCPIDWKNTPSLLRVCLYFSTDAENSNINVLIC